MPRRNLLSTTASIVPPSNSDSVESKDEAPGIGHNGGPPLTPGSDIVWGLEGIATEINRTVPQVRWLIGQGKVRIKRHGRRTISASRKQLHEDCAGEYQNPNR
jgi:hypothetical protein